MFELTCVQLHSCTHTLRRLAFFFPFLIFLFHVLFSDTHKHEHTYARMLVDVASTTLHFVLHKLGLPRGEGSRLAMTAQCSKGPHRKPSLHREMNSFLATHTHTNRRTDTHIHTVYVLIPTHADLSQISCAGVCLGEVALQGRSFMP